MGASSALRREGFWKWKIFMQKTVIVGPSISAGPGGDEKRLVRCQSAVPWENQASGSSVGVCLSPSSPLPPQVGSPLHPPYPVHLPLSKSLWKLKRLDTLLSHNVSPQKFFPFPPEVHNFSAPAQPRRVACAARVLGKIATINPGAHSLALKGKGRLGSSLSPQVLLGPSSRCQQDRGTWGWLRGEAAPRERGQGVKGVSGSAGAREKAEACRGARDSCRDSDSNRGRCGHRAES